MKVNSVAVGSTNPVKIAAVTKAISKDFPKASINGIDVTSDVSDQPLTSTETLKGSINRAKKALKQLNTDIGVGLEGGVDPIDKYFYNIVWCTAVDKQGNLQSVSGLHFALPQKLNKAIKNGEEMGPAMDAMIGSANIKQKQGALGVVTGDWITRTQGYTHLVRLAFGRLLTVNWK